MFAPYFQEDELALPTADRVRVRWLGTAGFALEYQGTTVLFDPYLTRASLLRVVGTRLVPDAAAIAAHASRADAIVVGHSHFDHVLDVPAIAALTGARVFGSRSAVTLCRASGLPEAQLHDVERSPGADAAVAEVGPFELRFHPSAHSRFALGRVPFPGEITDCDHVPLRAERYECGAVFAVEVRVGGRTILHLGSAELVEAQLRVREPDLLLLCAAGWTSSRDLPERVGSVISPRAVLLSHWDDFFRSIDKPARALPALQLPSLIERLDRANRDAKIGVVPLLGGLWI